MMNLTMLSEHSAKLVEFSFNETATKTLKVFLILRYSMFKFFMLFLFKLIS